MSLFAGEGSQTTGQAHLVEFKAGKMKIEGKTVTPDKRKGLIYIHQGEDSLVHFCWKDRTTGTVEDDLIIFPDEVEFKKLASNYGRVFLLEFKTSKRKMFFWPQDLKTDKDDEHVRLVNDTLNNPPSAMQEESRGAADGEGELDNQQLMQMFSGAAGVSGLPTGMETQGLVAPTAHSRTGPQDAGLPTTETNETSEPDQHVANLRRLLQSFDPNQPRSDVDVGNVLSPEQILPLLSHPQALHAFQ
eukprot:Colp12_sorted_trinity150504_noHs@14354